MLAKSPKTPRVIPGFELTLGFSLAYLSLLVLIPFAALGLRASGVGWSGFAQIIGDARVQAAFRTSFGTAFVAACINAVFGLLVAWVLVRYSFPGKRIYRRTRRSALRAADSGGGYRPHHPLCAQRPPRQPP